jgi:hypothetical protein
MVLSCRFRAPTALPTTKRDAWSKYPNELSGSAFNFIPYLLPQRLHQYVSNKSSDI